MRKTLLAALLVCGNLGLLTAARAQERNPAPRHGVSIQFGTTGAGLQVSRQLSPRLTARVGASYFAYRKMIEVETGEEGGKLNITPDAVIGIGQATVKWHPFFSKKKGMARSFFLTGGAGYTWHPDFGVTLQSTENIKFGGLEMSPENVGTINAGLRYSNLMGYAGLGFGRSIPRHRVGFGVELGCYYLSSPKVKLAYDGFLEATTLDEQIPTVERNMKDYRYLPSLQFHLSIALGNRN